MAVGFPQCLAVTLERVSDSPAGLQFHAGTVLVASSVGARLLIVRRHSVAPYAFFGGGVLHVAEGEGGGGTGATGYGWVGAGLRLGTGSLTWFGELGVVFGLDEGKGYDAAAPTLAVGVAFGR